jgi:hypothetical protein
MLYSIRKGTGHELHALCNEESEYCVVPHSCRILHTLPPSDEIITEDEYKQALDIVDKYKKNKLSQEQKSQYMGFLSSLQN